jgi:glyoxylase-like metal-dependent hydrolase (beta-lactamase superfamily II)/8-oxo-dGTP pyrophosphatase MutT (NUDIX family)
VLLGLRARGARFMPGQLSCPGGGVDPADRPDTPGAYRRCVRRELIEETGIDVPEGEWIEAGERTTPPMFPLRFRTRFFVAPFPEDVAPHALAPTTGENEKLRLARPRDVLGEWERGRARLPPPILPLMRALAEAEGSLERVAAALATVNAQEDRAPRIEFVPGLWMLPLHTATLPPATHTNVWMPGSTRFVLIDPGSDEEAEHARLLEVVERRRLLGHRPQAVLLTHHHQDHVSGAARLARALKLPLRAHPATLDILRPALDGIECRPLVDGESVELDRWTLIALHTPGHAPGHLAFHLPGPNLLVTGDLISGLSTILIDPTHGDMGAYLASLERATGLGCRMLLPGHGPPLPGERLDALLEHRRERQRRILGALAPAGTPLSGIAGAAYIDTPGLPPPLIEGQTLAHLVYLEQQDEAQRVDDAGTSWRLP